MWKNVAIIAGWILLAFILIQVAMHLIGMVMMIALMVGVACLIGAPIFFYIKHRTSAPQSSKLAEVESAETKLYEPAGSIRIFANEPTASQILMIGGQTTETPKFIEVPNDTVIKIVEDNDKHAIKIKVTAGANKGKTGWVSRGAVIKTK